MVYLSRFIIALMISFTLTELPIMKAEAAGGLITTQEAFTEYSRTQGEANVTNFIARSDVKDKLIELGVDPVDAQKRVAGLSNKDVKKLDMEIQKATIAGDIGGILIVVLLIILIIYFAKRI